jgi:hypothetical protein
MTAAPRSITESLVDLVGNRTFQLVTLLLYAFFLNHEGFHVPAGNEQVYLLYVYKAWHPQFMAADWTFHEPSAGHAFFNYTTGWLMLLMPMGWAAWVGRIACWVLGLIGLMRLGSHFKIPSWAVWLGILLWMVQGQALPTTAWSEWFIGSFEAKCCGYICLIYALDAALREKAVAAGLLAGLCFSFHSAVGLWGGAALGWAVLTQFPIRKTLAFCGCTVVTGLAGLIPSLPLIFGSHAITPDEAKFMVTRAAALCFDPTTFYRPYVALLILMVIFAWLYHRPRKGQASALLFQFQIALFVFYAFGFVARAMDRFDLLILFPLRVFSVLVMLFFFWQFFSVVIALWQTRGRNEPGQILLGSFGLLVFLGLPSPIARIAEIVAMHLHYQSWIGETPVVAADDNLENKSDFRAAASWVHQNTPEKAVVIAPPWRGDAFYFIQRPLIANWHDYRYDDVTGWRKRMEKLVGDLSNLDANDIDHGDLDLAARAHYRNLPASSIAALQREFGATWLITTSEYPYREIFSSGAWKVYQLDDPSRPNSNDRAKKS